MSKIESIIQFNCKLSSDCDWTLSNKDLARIAEDIKEDIIEEIRNKPQTWEDALEAVQEF